jgi:predicted N-acetyltransferase YhbS
VGQEIRNVRPEEFETLMLFLNRCFGFSAGGFERYYPHLYRPTDAFYSTAHVVESNGQIVSHVGLYPLEVVVQGVSVPMGGIGAVATLPSARGEGHMTKLLHHTIKEMRDSGYPLSWLVGDRQRYKTFGWERAGMIYDLSFSHRSLERVGIEAAPLEARFPEDAVDVVERFQSLPVYHTRRPDLVLQLRKDELRLWTMEDGYVIVEGPSYGRLSIAELVSASGQEASMIRAVLDWTGRRDISWELPAVDADRIARIMHYASGWRAGGGQMYRIIDLSGLLTAMKPILSQRAALAPDLQLAICIEEHDRTDAATIWVRDGDVEIAPGRHGERCVEWTSVEAARALLGGPPVAAGVPAELGALLPLPVYLPPLDHV